MPSTWLGVVEVYREKDSLPGGPSGIYYGRQPGGLFEWRLSDATSAAGYSVTGILLRISGSHITTVVARPLLRPRPRKRRFRGLFASTRFSQTKTVNGYCAFWLRKTKRFKRTGKSDKYDCKP